jgi:hypothetical protein
LDVFLLPLLPAVLWAAATCDQTATVDDRAFERHRFPKTVVSILPYRWSTGEGLGATRDFDLLVLVVIDMPRDLHRVAYKRIPARMMHRALHSRLVLDPVDHET